MANVLADDGIVHIVYVATTNLEQGVTRCNLPFNNRGNSYSYWVKGVEVFAMPTTAREPSCIKCVLSVGTKKPWVDWS